MTQQTSKYCDEFLQHPYKNPYTNRMIKINGPIYLGLVDECGKPASERKQVPLNLSLLNVRQLRRLASEYQIRVSDLTRKSDLLRVLEEELDPEEISESLQKPLYRPANLYGNILSNQYRK